MKTAIRSTLLVFIILICSSLCCAAEKRVLISKPVFFVTGFMKGEGFLNLSETEQAAYAMGILDGYTAAPLFGGDNKYLKWINSGLKGKTNTQMVAILVKYLKDHPEKWDGYVQILMYEALKDAFPE